MAVETLSWIGSIMLLVSVYMTGKHNRKGWQVSACGSALWLLYGLIAGMSSLVFINFAMMAIAFRNYLSWGGNSDGK